MASTRISEANQDSSSKTTSKRNESSIESNTASSHCSNPDNDVKSTKKIMAEEKRQVKELLQQVKMTVLRQNPKEKDLVLNPILLPVTQKKVQIPEAKLCKRCHPIL